MPLSTLFACLLTAGLTVSLTLWWTNEATPPVPHVLIPERLADQSDGYLMMIGGWITDGTEKGTDLFGG